jgi:hypothetical protein
MAISKRDLVNILHILYNTFNDLTDEQYSKLLRGEGNLIFVEKTEKKVGKSDSAVQKSDIAIYEKIGEEIQSCETKEAALKAIRNNPLLKSKDSLLKLANVLQIHIVKKDNRERIEEKIVGSLVGSRIRSNAIMNLNLNEGG